MLALINSTLINYWFSFFYFDVNIKPEQLRQIPIKEITEQEQLPFITFVDKILYAKKLNPQADTSAWEKEIDALVYQLYGLSDEEVKMVEGG